ncbi:MAG TPA: cold shock and DUF1294 domain-containing protein [Luteimonas sp.]|nr:cold shock and DUF1294 domain-containing protein [Luteimonas sp.]
MKAIAAVRLAGRITDWSDDKGFGFVVPNGGGERAFVHINEFQRGSRRPLAGDQVSYLPCKDSRGRLQAREVRHAGQKIEPRQQSSRFPRTFVGIGALAVAAGTAVIGLVPLWIPAVYVSLSGVSWLMYRSDKVAAQRGFRRTPESSLHLVDVLGGWPGALIAQQQLRHKTIKQPFQSMFWITAMLNVAATGWLISSGLASGL